MLQSSREYTEILYYGAWKDAGLHNTTRIYVIATLPLVQSPQVESITYLITLNILVCYFKCLSDKMLLKNFSDETY